MPQIPDRDVERLHLIPSIIARLERLKGVPREAMFADDRDELDLTAYRLSAIGETANKLSAQLRDANPTVDWRGMYYLRNIVSHEYELIDPSQIWSIIGSKLTDLKRLCEAELAARTPTPD